jgi:hypothetical protein
VKLHSWVTILGQQGTEVQDRSSSTLGCTSLYALIHRSAWKGNSQKFAPGFGIRHHAYGGKLTRRGSGGKENATTAPQRLRARRIRPGALALVLSGLALVPVPFLQNIPTNPEQNVAFALGANTLAWRFSLVLAFIYFALLVLGSFALYARLARTRVERWAFAGLVVTVGFLVLYIPITGFAAYVVPAVGVLIEGGHADAVEVMEQTFREPFAAVSFLSGILYYVGIVLTGVAVWRSETLWRWGGLLYIVSGVVGIPAFLDVPFAQNVAPLVWAAAVVGVSLWRSV